MWPIPTPRSCTTAALDTEAEVQVSAWPLRSPVTLDKALAVLSWKTVPLTLCGGCQREGLQGLEVG